MVIGRLLSTEERNYVMVIESHKERRLVGDLIYIYKNIDNTSLFELRSDTRRRGNDKPVMSPFIEIWSSVIRFLIETCAIGTIYPVML